MVQMYHLPAGQLMREWGKRMSDEQNVIQNPPPKVKAMYQAVINLLKTERDITTIKVADITSSAGIGKGTAYEYFSTKEEILSSAIIYYVNQCIENVKEIAQKQENFHDKLYDIMDFADEHVKDRQAIFALLKIILNAYEVPDSFKAHFDNMQNCSKAGAINEIIDILLESARKEGLVSQKEVFFQRAAIETTMRMYFMYKVEAEHNKELDLEADTLREYIYQNTLKLLG